MPHSDRIGLAEIAAQLGISAQAVHLRAQRLGLPARHAVGRGYTSAEVAAIRAAPPIPTGRKRTSPQAPPRTTARALATEFGVSRATIQLRAHALGIPPQRGFDEAGVAALRDQFNARPRNMRKLHPDEVRAIRRAFAAGANAHDLAATYDVVAATIQQIASGFRWGNLDQTPSTTRSD